MNNRLKYTLAIDASMQTYGKKYPQKDLLVYTDQKAQFTAGKFQ
jgi:putative transposase